MNPWLETLQKKNTQLQNDGLVRRLQMRESPNAPEVQLEGKKLLSFCSNDYLGLSNHPSLAEALAAGAVQFGVGSGASPLISGHTNAHAKLEQALAQTQNLHIPNVSSCLMSTGFMANVGALTALASLGQISFFSDSLNHASIIDGIRFAKTCHQATVSIFQHSDYDHLKSLLELDQNSLKCIVTDGVFSMDGDIANLPELLSLAEHYSALLYVDDAHGFGVLGENGHGSLEHFGLNSSLLIYMGTLGKAAGISGAFLASGNLWIDWFTQAARPLIYSTNTSPALSHALMNSLELMHSSDGATRREKLFNNIHVWHKNAVFKRWHCLQSSTPIQPLIIGDNNETLFVSRRLKEKGFWVPAIRPPTVPINSARLRITLNADHTPEMVYQLLHALKEIETEIDE